MALIKCPECGKEISDLAKTCPNCGRPVSPKNISQYFIKEPKINNKKDVRFVLNVIALSLSCLVSLLISSSEGGFDGNYELSCAAILLLIPSIIGLCGRRSKVATIVSASFYFFSAIADIGYMATHAPCVIFLGISIGFGITLLVSALSSPKQ